MANAKKMIEEKKAQLGLSVIILTLFNNQY